MGIASSRDHDEQLGGVNRDTQETIFENATNIRNDIKNYLANSEFWKDYTDKIKTISSLTEDEAARPSNMPGYYEQNVRTFVESKNILTRVRPILEFSKRSNTSQQQLFYNFYKGSLSLETTRDIISLYNQLKIMMSDTTNEEDLPWNSWNNIIDKTLKSKISKFIKPREKTSDIIDTLKAKPLPQLQSQPTYIQNTTTAKQIPLPGKQLENELNQFITNLNIDNQATKNARWESIMKLTTKLLTKTNQTLRDEDQGKLQSWLSQQNPSANIKTITTAFLKKINELGDKAWVHESSSSVSIMKKNLEKTLNSLKQPKETPEPPSPIPEKSKNVLPVTPSESQDNTVRESENSTGDANLSSPKPLFEPIRGVTQQRADILDIKPADQKQEPQAKLGNVEKIDVSGQMRTLGNPLDISKPSATPSDNETTQVGIVNPLPFQSNSSDAVENPERNPREVWGSKEINTLEAASQDQLQKPSGQGTWAAASNRTFHIRERAPGNANLQQQDSSEEEKHRVWTGNSDTFGNSSKQGIPPSPGTSVNVVDVRAQGEQPGSERVQNDVRFEPDYNARIRTGTQLNYLDSLLNPDPAKKQQFNDELLKDPKFAYHLNRIRQASASSNPPTSDIDHAKPVAPLDEASNHVRAEIERLSKQKSTETRTPNITPPQFSPYKLLKLYEPDSILEEIGTDEKWISQMHRIAIIVINVIVTRLTQINRDSQNFKLQMDTLNDEIPSPHPIIPIFFKTFPEDKIAEIVDLINKNNQTHSKKYYPLVPPKRTSFRTILESTYFENPLVANDNRINQLEELIMFAIRPTSNIEQIQKQINEYVKYLNEIGKFVQPFVVNSNDEDTIVNLDTEQLKQLLLKYLDFTLKLQNIMLRDRISIDKYA